MTAALVALAATPVLFVAGLLACAVRDNRAARRRTAAAIAAHEAAFARQFARVLEEIHAAQTEATR